MKKLSLSLPLVGFAYRALAGRLGVTNLAIAACAVGIVLFVAWLAVLLISWQGVMIDVLGARPLEGAIGTALFLLGVVILGRLVGPVAVVVGMVMLVFGGSDFRWLDMSLSASQMFIYGLYMFFFGARYPSGDTARSDAKAPAAGDGHPGLGAVSTEADATPPAVDCEQPHFSAVLTEVGPNKVPVIVVVREMTGLGLKEAKDLVDAAPAPVREGINLGEAREIKAALEEQGAKVEIGQSADTNAG